jgi:putative membrane protein
LVAIATETGAEDFLGTQGYEWDTQADMFWALIGGLVMILLFTKIHNKAIKKMEIK